MASNTHRLTFDANGGELVGHPSPYVRELMDGDVVENLPQPTRVGHTFGGWWLYKRLGTQYEVRAGEPIILGADATCFAKWTPDKCQIVFDPNGGSISEDEGSREVDYGWALGVLPEPAYVGRVFLGWFSEDGATQAAPTTLVKGDKTWHAKWQLKEYTLTFLAEGGDPSETTIVRKHGEKLGTLPQSTKLGHSLKRWVDDGGVAASKNDVVEETKTYHAIFEADRYTISFFSNGGVFSEGPIDGETPPSEGTTSLRTTSQSFGAALQKLDQGREPTRTGYTFVGWLDDEDGEELVAGKTVEKPTTYSAQWSVNKYTIKFEPNGGVGNMDDLQMTYGAVPVTLPPNQFTKSNKVKYHPKVGPLWREDADTVDEDIELIAVWKVGDGGGAPTTTVRFKKDAEDIAPIVWEQVPVSGLFGHLPHAQRNGKTFQGWFTDPTNGSAISESQRIDANATTTYYAHWSDAPHAITEVKRAFTVKFRPDNGDNAFTRTVHEGCKIGLMPKPTKPGCSLVGWAIYAPTASCANDSDQAPAQFVGWSLTETGQKVYDDEGVVGDNLSEADGAVITLYAQWESGGITLPTATRTGGWQFEKWHSIDENGIEQEEGAAGEPLEQVDEDMDLYAHWVDKRITITYHKNFNGV